MWANRFDGRRLFCTGFYAAAVMVFLPTPWMDRLRGQDTASESESRERLLAERFMTVLMRRPRPGTALDRVYGYHVQNGSLEELMESLDVDADQEDSGVKQMVLGLLQAQRGKHAAACDAFAKAEERLPEDAICSYLLGKSLLAIGRTEEAAAAVERSIERGPARNEALPIFTELGRIYGRAGQREKALEVWTKLEALFPGDAKVGGQIARTLAEDGDLEGALDRYEALAKASRRSDEQVGFAVRAAEMKRRLGKADECTRSLEAILKRLRPGSWLYNDVRNRIEQGFLKSGDYDALASYYQRKLDETPDDVALQIRLGRILVSARRLGQATEILRAAVEKAPTDIDVRLGLIDVLVNQGDMAAASTEFEELARLDPDNPDHLLRWGQVVLDDESLALDERRNRAAKIWNRLADARSDDAVTLSQVADRMRSIERTDDAICALRTIDRSGSGIAAVSRILGRVPSQARPQGGSDQGMGVDRRRRPPRPRIACSARRGLPGLQGRRPRSQDLAHRGGLRSDVRAGITLRRSSSRSEGV